MKLLWLLLGVGCGGKITSNSVDTDTETQPSEEPGAEPASEASSEPSSPSDEPSSEPSSPTSEPTQEPVEENVDYSIDGSYSVSSSTGSASIASCANGMEYSVFTPSGVSNPPVMILGHGFARSGSNMHGLAEQYASWGVEVIVPNLCHSSFWDADHEQNGMDMVELAQQYGAMNVIYAGQSAGGLAALVAASQDSNALGVVGLDATDTNDTIGLTYATSVQVPTYALLGEPSSCNSDNNGLSMFELVNDINVMRVTSSDHCDYESPTDWMCTTFCLNQSNSFDDAEIAPAIMFLSTAAVMKIVGTNTSSDAWETEMVDEWTDMGLLNRIR